MDRGGQRGGSWRPWRQKETDTVPNEKAPSPYESDDPEPSPGDFRPSRRTEDLGRAYMAVAKKHGRAAAHKFFWKQQEGDTDEVLKHYGHLAPSMISVWQFAQPVATIPLAYAFFAELPSGRQLGGCWLILVALAAVCYDSMRQVWTL